MRRQLELDRLNLQHHVLKLLLNGELTVAALADPKNILDLGTGTGIWGIEMADRYPHATIIGTDMSPIQPTWYSSNVGTAPKCCPRVRYALTSDPGSQTISDFRSKMPRVPGFTRRTILISSTQDT